MSSNDIERVIECSSQRRLVINAQSFTGLSVESLLRNRDRLIDIARGPRDSGRKS